MNKERAIFQCMRHAMHMQKEFEDTKRLEFLKRQRQRHEELRAYLNAVSETVVSLKQNRSFYYD